MFILSFAKNLSTRLALVWLVSVMVVSNLAGQRPVAVQIDEFGRSNCDDYLARIDNLINNLQKNPNARGLVVISGDPKYLLNKVRYELNFEGATDWRKFEDGRVAIAWGKRSGDFKVRFWLVPAGAYLPEFDDTERNYKLPPRTKPFILHDDMEQICWTPTFAKVYEILNANPRSRGNVVVFAASKRAYAKGVREARANLKGISPSRLRFFYSHTGTADPYAEYWIVP